MTLVELLITIVIIAIISAAILGTASAAMEQARRARTRTTITKIHQLLVERMAEYESRRIPLATSVMAAAGGDFSVTPNTPGEQQKARGQSLADVRLLGVRELMKYEMPDRWSDLLLIATNPQATLPTTASSLPLPRVLASRPALAEIYLRRFFSRNPSATTADVLRYQSAECLYMIVMTATGDGEARTMFTDQDIGDTDNDGLPEILDGWRQPIGWVRWPAGFAPTPLMAGNGLADHDPFDPYRRDDPNTKVHRRPVKPGYNDFIIGELANLETRAANPASTGAFRLVPLIFSAGADGVSDINTKADAYVAPLDPYFGLFDQSDRPPGAVTGEGAKDNIHNQLTEY